MNFIAVNRAASTQNGHHNLMRYLTEQEILYLHQHLHRQTGGGSGVRDQGALESALAQPQQSFYGKELHTTVVAKAAALGFSLIANPPLVDGNNHLGHAAMEVFLLLNGYEIRASVDEQESVILQAAAGVLKREELADWLSRHVMPKTIW